MNQRLAQVRVLLLVAIFLLISVVPSQAASTTLLVERFTYAGSSEYIKIKNISAASINLSTYRVGDEETSGGGEGMSWLPNINLAVGASIIIARDADDWSYSSPVLPDYSLEANSQGVTQLTKDIGNWCIGGCSVGLTNNDEVVLIDSTGNLIDGACWGSSSCNFNNTGNNTILTDGPLNTAGSPNGFKRQSDIDTDTTVDWAQNPTAITLSSLTAHAAAPWTGIALAGLLLGALVLVRRKR